MRNAALIVVAVVAAASGLGAQTSRTIRPEIRPFAGAMIPTGSQRDLFMDAAVAGVQVAVELKPSLHVLSTFAWAPARDRFGMGSDRVTILQYSVGMEFGFVEPLAGEWELRPFIGAGLGGRSYAYESAALTDRHCNAAYAALGTEFQLARTALRFEVRDNTYCFRSPIEGVSSTGANEIGLSLGIAYHLR